MKVGSVNGYQGSDIPLVRFMHDLPNVAMMGPMYHNVLSRPDTVPRYRGGATSTTYMGAAVVATVQKNESRKRPPIKVGTASRQHSPSEWRSRYRQVFAVAVTMVPRITPKQPRNMGTFLPCQSASQTNRAPVI